MAAAANAEIRARRLDASGSGLKYREQRGFREAPAFVRGLDLDQLARQCVGNENNLPVCTRQAGAAVDRFLDAELHAWAM